MRVLEMLTIVGVLAVGSLAWAEEEHTPTCTTDARVVFNPETDKPVSVQVKVCSSEDQPLKPWFVELIASCPGKPAPTEDDENEMMFGCRVGRIVGPDGAPMRQDSLMTSAFTEAESGKITIEYYTSPGSNSDMQEAEEESRDYCRPGLPNVKRRTITYSLSDLCG